MFFTIITLSACGSDSHHDSILDPILCEFVDAGITLKEQGNKSETFTFFGSDEKHYEFNEGTIYLLYNFKNRESVIENLTKVFAETEFPYHVDKLYTDKFIIIFVANSDNSNTKKKVEKIFQKLEEYK